MLVLTLRKNNVIEIFDQEGNLIIQILRPSKDRLGFITSKEFTISLKKDEGNIAYRKEKEDAFAKRSK